MLFISSKYSIDSNWSIYEIGKNIEEKRTVIPLILDNEGVRNLPESLNKFQWLDFRTSYKEALDLLISTLQEKGFESAKPIVIPRDKSKGYVFLSYCDEDHEFLITLRNFLKDKGYGYWDYEESRRDYNALFFLEIEEAIQGAVATLSVLSPEWKKSQWAVKEYIFSGEVKTPVFLLMSRKMQPTLVIAGIPFIDFTTDSNEGFRKLKVELERKKL